VKRAASSGSLDGEAKSGWQNGIVNHFVHDVPSAFVEGKNSQIKAIKLMAFRDRNIKSRKMRIFLSNDQIAAKTDVSGGFHACLRRAN